MLSENPVAMQSNISSINWNPNQNYGEGISSDDTSSNLMFKPRLDITDETSTYTKTIHLTSGMTPDDNSQSQLNVTINGNISHKMSIPKSHKHEKNFYGQYQQKKVTYSDSTNDFVNQPKTLPDNNESQTRENKSFIKSRPQACFLKLARRFSIRRTMPKSNSSFTKQCNPTTPNSNPSTRIRRWFSKHLLSSTNKIETIADVNSGQSEVINSTISEEIYGNLSPRLSVNSTQVQCGSVPVVRRDIGPCDTTLSHSSINTASQDVLYSAVKENVNGTIGSGLCSSQTTDFSLVQNYRPDTDRQNSEEGAVSSRSGASRYLNVSLAAFGYTGCNRKWVSAQALEVDKPNFTERHKSTSPPPTFVGCAQVHRPPPLDLTHLKIPTVAQNGNSPDNQQSEVSMPTSNEKNELKIYPSDDNKGPQNGLTDFCLQPVSSENSNDQSKVHIRIKRGTSSLTEDRQRSSLIMLAVAQASPRPHPLSSTVTPPTSPVISSPHAIQCCPSPNTSSPLRNFGVRKITFNDDPAGFINDLNKIDEVEVRENGDGNIVHNVNGHFPLLNGQSSPVPHLNGVGLADGGQKKDGFYFLKQVDELAEQLTEKVAVIEQDLVSQKMSEEVAGQLRTTAGKVKLLLSQKFMQFRGLCDESISQQFLTSTTASGFITLPSDLDGFWAMILLQVDDVMMMIKSVDLLRLNAWMPIEETPTPLKKRINQSNGHPTPMKHRDGGKSSHARNEQAPRSQARERLKAAKRDFLARRELECSASDTNPDHVPQTAASYLIV